VILDDGDRARLHRIERQLEQEEPELAAALQQWAAERGVHPDAAGPPVPIVRRVVAAALVVAVAALLLDSPGWLLVAVLTAALGWCLLRSLGEPLVPGTDPDAPAP
jgi:hypothetical protein